VIRYTCHCCSCTDQYRIFLDILDIVLHLMRVSLSPSLPDIKHGVGDKKTWEETAALMEEQRVMERKAREENKKKINEDYMQKILSASRRNSDQQHERRSASKMKSISREDSLRIREEDEASKLKAQISMRARSGSRQRQRADTESKVRSDYERNLYLESEKKLLEAAERKFKEDSDRLQKIEDTRLRREDTVRKVRLERESKIKEEHERRVSLINDDPPRSRSPQHVEAPSASFYMIKEEEELREKISNDRKIFQERAKQAQLDKEAARQELVEKIIREENEKKIKLEKERVLREENERVIYLENQKQIQGEIERIRNENERKRIEHIELLAQEEVARISRADERKRKAEETERLRLEGIDRADREKRVSLRRLSTTWKDKVESAQEIARRLKCDSEKKVREETDLRLAAEREAAAKAENERKLFLESARRLYLENEAKAKQEAEIVALEESARAALVERDSVKADELEKLTEEHLQAELMEEVEKRVISIQEKARAEEAEMLKIQNAERADRGQRLALRRETTDWRVKVELAQVSMKEDDIQRSKSDFDAWVNMGKVADIPAEEERKNEAIAKEEADRVAKVEEALRVRLNQESAALEDVERAAVIERERVKAAELEKLREEHLQAEMREEARADEAEMRRALDIESMIQEEKVTARRLSSEFKMAFDTNQGKEQRQCADSALRIPEDAERKLEMEREAAARFAAEKKAYAEGAHMIYHETITFAKGENHKVFREEEARRLRLNQERVALEESVKAAQRFKAAELEKLKDESLRAEAKELMERTAASNKAKAKANEAEMVKALDIESKIQQEKVLARRLSSELKMMSNTAKEEEQKLRVEKARKAREDVERKIENEKEAAARFVAEKKSLAESERRAYLENESKAKIQAERIAREEEARRVKINQSRLILAEMEKVAVIEREKVKAAERERLKDVKAKTEAKEEAERKAKHQLIKANADELLLIKERKAIQKAEAEKVALRKISDSYLLEEEVRFLNEKAENGRSSARFKQARDAALALEKEKKTANDIHKKEAGETLRKLLLDGEKKKLQMENERVAKGLSARKIRDGLDKVVRAEAARAKIVEQARKSAELAELKARNALEKKRKEDSARRTSYRKYKENCQTVQAEKERRQQELIMLNIEKENARLARIEYDKRRTMESERRSSCERRYSSSTASELQKVGIRAKKEGERKSREEALEYDKKLMLFSRGKSAEDIEHKRVTHDRKRLQLIENEKSKEMERQRLLVLEMQRKVAYETVRSLRDENAAKVRVECSSSKRSEIMARQAELIERKSRDGIERKLSFDEGRRARERIEGVPVRGFGTRTHCLSDSRGSSFMTFGAKERVRLRF
jgi:hypothetical protein